MSFDVLVVLPIDRSRYEEVFYCDQTCQYLLTLVVVCDAILLSTFAPDERALKMLTVVNIHKGLLSLRS